MTLLSKEEEKEFISLKPGWSLSQDEKSASCEILFSDFVEAWGVMNEIALIAESMDHHPEWENAYNRVNIRLTTHDDDNLTERDLVLARAIENILSRRV